MAMTEVLAAPSPIRSVLAARSLRSVFQPIVSLGDGSLVALEALTRGPAGPLESPVALLEAAEAAGVLAELDELCRQTAMTSARRWGWPVGTALFLNTEPHTLTPATFQALAEAAEEGLQVVVELTERDLGRDLATLLDAGEQVRRAGALLALDDVGANPASLALLPLLRPDVVKLDMTIVRGYAAGPMAEIANAVRAYAEESGATVVAEGIETADDVQTADVLGAHLGQGWHFGRPDAAFPTTLTVRSHPIPRVAARPGPTGETPFDVVSSQRHVATTTKALLLPISMTLEQRGAKMIIPGVLLSAFQGGHHFTPATRRRYAALAHTIPLIYALGASMGTSPAPRVRGIDLRAHDPLEDEWTVIVLGAHFAAALVARDLGDTGPDPVRRFSYVVTHDRALVTAAARSLITRLTTAEPTPPGPLTQL